MWEWEAEGIGRWCDRRNLYLGCKAKTTWGARGGFKVSRAMVTFTKSFLLPWGR